MSKTLICSQWHTIYRCCNNSRFNILFHNFVKLAFCSSLFIHTQGGARGIYVLLLKCIEISGRFLTCYSYALPLVALFCVKSYTLYIDYRKSDAFNRNCISILIPFYKNLHVRLFLICFSHTKRTRKDVTQ